MSCLHPKKFAREMCSACYQRARRAGELAPKVTLEDRVTVRVSEGVREAARRATQSVAEYVRDAVSQRMKREARKR